MSSLDWMDEALCLQAPAELFHPVSGESPNIAKKLCHACPVIATCLTWALTTQQGTSGVLGGLTERERNRLTRHPAAT